VTQRDATWTILVATLGQRAERLERLLGQLLPQLDAHDGAVTVCALYNHGERGLGAVRQDLVEHATSTYVSFVDDDDEVPDYFVTEVLARLDGRVDYVGWRMQCYVDGVPLKPTFHSLRYDRWHDDADGFYRDVSHLNPVRAELARLADFRRGSPPEDVSWADQVRPHVRTEAYVDRVMYHYRSSSADSTWRGDGVSRVGARSSVTHPYLSWHPGSSE
jgi:glycosyltransferase involved in cell wall biosynthesis